MDLVTLREHYAPPLERARLKTLSKLDRHCRNFIAKSPFVCMGTASEDGADVTPRGGPPGFVHVLDDVTLSIPDSPGNNRLDSFTNLVSNPNVGLLFLIPGVDETLRVNGTAQIVTDSEILARWEGQQKSALVISVREAFLHCGKALIRARLWKDDYKIARSELPPYGQMLKEQTHVAQTAEEIQADVEDAYRNKLF